MRGTEMSWVRLLFLLWILAPSVAGENAQPVYATSGVEATLMWRLPEDVRQAPVLVSLESPDNAVFLASVGKGGLLAVSVVETYRERIKVNDTLVEGHILLTISNVTSDVAGTYLCLRGPSEKDAIPSCGQTLVVIEAPQELRVTPLGDPVIASNLTLRCMASSASRPRDQNRRMIFRWFDSAVSESPSVTAAAARYDYASVGEGHHEEQPVELGSSADLEELPVTGLNLTNDTITIWLLGKSDEGRRLACSASEGLGVWSEWSENFVVHPLWGPTEKDIRLTPSEDVINVVSGHSAKVTCTSACRPTCGVTWKKVMSAETWIVVSKGHTLTLSNVSLAQGGVYACVASNIHGESSRTLVVTVTENSRGLPVPDSDDSLVSGHNRLALVLVAVSAIALALGMTGVAYIFYASRKRSQSVRWRPRTDSDLMPLSFMKRSDAELTS